MERILEVIQQFHNLVSKSGVISKDSLAPYTYELDDMLCDFLGDISPNYDDMPYISTNDDKARLSSLEEKLRKVKTSPQVALCEIADFGDNKLRLFLDKYNIGFVKDINLTAGGIFVCEIGCIIYSHSVVGDKRASAAKKFERQMDFLKSVGFDIGQSKIGGSSPVLLGTQQNLDLIIRIISDLGGMGISCSINSYKGQETIRSISFRIKCADLFSYDGKIKEKEVGISKNLNEDERLFLVKESDDLYNALCSFVDKDLIRAASSCRNIILHSFASICGTIGVQSRISKSVDDYFSEGRKINTLINQKTEELQASLSTDLDVKSIVEDVRKRFCKIGLEELGYTISSFEIGHTLNMSFRFNTLGESWEFDDVCAITQGNFKKRFKTTNGEFENETLFMLSLPENIEKLSEILLSFVPSAKITSINTEYNWRTSEYVIKEFSVSVEDLSTL